MVKLWEKSAIAKIAIKRGIPNTCNDRMAEEIKVKLYKIPVYVTFICQLTLTLMVKSVESDNHTSRPNLEYEVSLLNSYKFALYVSILLLLYIFG